MNNFVKVTEENEIDIDDEVHFISEGELRIGTVAGVYRGKGIAQSPPVHNITIAEAGKSWGVTVSIDNVSTSKDELIDKQIKKLEAMR